MKKAWVAVAAGVVLVAGYLASPVFAFHQLRAAAQSGDRDRLEEAVDFPAVRDSLKAQISAGVLQALSPNGDLRGRPLAALGSMLLPGLADRMVDSIVTPDGIALMIQQGRVRKANGPDSGAGRGAGREANGRVSVSYSYRTLDRFRVTVTRVNDYHKSLDLTLERRGLFSWKLVRIDLPPALFGDRQPADAAASPAP